MRRRVLTVAGVIGLLCTVAVAAKERGIPAPGPERGAIGMAIKVKAQLAMGGWLYATRVYLARVGEGGDPLRADEVIESNFEKKSQVFLLNAEPGRYVLVGAQTPEFRSTGGASGAPAVTVLLDKEMIPRTEVTVEAGKISFMGEIVVKTGASMEDADEVQKHYGEIIGAKTEFSINIGGPGPAIGANRLARPGTGQGLDKEPKTERDFWEHAIKKVFDDGDGWSRLVQARLE